MRPDAAHHVYYSARFEDALQHGADITLRASFAFKARGTIVDGASTQRTTKPGNPQTVLVTTVLPLPVELLELYVRLGTVGNFNLKQISGAEAIKAYLVQTSTAPTGE